MHKKIHIPKILLNKFDNNTNKIIVKYFINHKKTLLK
ncbi:Hypothetical Protein SLY_0341 [Strawberry lethal yellows phytoplasma (CPA) str. NZSb11]|uniref:Uncharacterized protein n=1 Tax=Strawberry lethal yellows phytoplasma (CPA) str. NZSb11 TaxID=980422 RepID=R4RP52_PHYAS|nr:Hypothetical Protein SLY_0341 [Strawberry lethal yellows phytoplasma (CPA) str. NZSb11]